ncbi:MAG: thermonuclease family protein [Verrucomicrobiaceae bacterium]|nr:thermonuclease family protein [Verrucomicrobiaceae bacterium]
MWSRITNYLWLLLMLGGIALAFRLQTGPADSPRARTRTEKKTRSEFVTLHDARLVEHRDNDGDSFHIEHDGGEDHEFRLYFVDAPEKRLHQFNGQRLEEQARYFGGLGVSQAIDIGQEAKAFTDDLLKRRHFTVKTRWQRVFDSGRYFAFVIFDEGSGRTEDLSEKLVRAGLCRIYTKGANLPDGRHEKQFEQHLRELEREAKARKQGAWRF